jgi:hypothetical protein
MNVKKMPAWLRVRDGHEFQLVMASIVLVFVCRRNMRPPSIRYFNVLVAKYAACKQP